MLSDCFECTDSNVLLERQGNNMDTGTVRISGIKVLLKQEVFRGGVRETLKHMEHELKRLKWAKEDH